MEALLAEQPDSQEAHSYQTRFALMACVPWFGTALLGSLAVFGGSIVRLSNEGAMAKACSFGP